MNTLQQAYLTDQVLTGKKLHGEGQNNNLRASEVRFPETVDVSRSRGLRLLKFVGMLHHGDGSACILRGKVLGIG